MSRVYSHLSGITQVVMTERIQRISFSQLCIYLPRWRNNCVYKLLKTTYKSYCVLVDCSIYLAIAHMTQIIVNILS